MIVDSTVAKCTRESDMVPSTEEYVMQGHLRCRIWSTLPPIQSVTIYTHNDRNECIDFSCLSLIIDTEYFLLHGLEEKWLADHFLDDKCF